MREGTLSLWSRAQPVILEVQFTACLVVQEISIHHFVLSDWTPKISFHSHENWNWHPNYFLRMKWDDFSKYTRSAKWVAKARAKTVSRLGGKSIRNIRELDTNYSYMEISCQVDLRNAINFFLIRYKGLISLSLYSKVFCFRSCDL